MNLLIRSLTIAGLMFTLVARSAQAATADTFSTVIDLEAKITQTIKSQIHSVDPDAVVSTTVSIRKTSTDLVGTQMQAIGIFTTSATQKIEDDDIQSVNVVIMSTLDPFPPSLAKIVEATVSGISKKGKLQIMKMDTAMHDAIAKNKEFERSSTEFQKASTVYQKSSIEQFEKISATVESMMREMPFGVLKLLGLVAVLQFMLLVLGGLFQLRSFRNLGDKISTIKFDAPTAAPQAPIERAPEAARPVAPAGSSTLTSQENPFKNMPNETLRAIFGDAYWCGEDRYSAWMWRQMSADAKIQLLDSWTVLGAYVRYLNQVEPLEGSYHLDVAYLKPEIYHHLSNEDILSIIADRKHLWHGLSAMRRQFMKVDLKDRLAFMSAAQLSQKTTWPVKPSLPRLLPSKIESVQLTSADEEMLYDNPGALSMEQEKQFPSLVWVALLPVPARTKILEAIPAQALAEIWLGPDKVLNRIKEVLPEKKRTLLEDYVTKVRPRSDSAWLTQLSNTALQQLHTPPPVVAAEPPAQSKAS